MISNRLLWLWAVPFVVFLAQCAAVETTCPAGQELNNDTGQCVQVQTSCPDGEERDPDSGLCVPVRTASLCDDVNCTDGDDCTEDVCDPADGTCSNPPADDGTSCSLGDADGICVEGQCEEGGTCGGLSCDDGDDCTVDVCLSEADGPCDHEPQVDGTVCDFGGEAGICFEGACEDAGECANIDCSDGIDCTDDLCVRGECTQHTANDANCDDGDTCTDDMCNPELGCENPALPSYTTCDDGASATFPDVCRSGVCTGASQGEMTTGAGTFEAVDIAQVSDSYVVLLNQGSNVHVHELVNVNSSQSLGSVTGEGHRLHVKGGSAYVAAGRLGDTGGGLNCNAEFSGACPLLGVWDGDGAVEWGGTFLHTALNGFGLSGIYAVNSWVDTAQVICQFPPCTNPFDTHWWFVGQRLVPGPRRPHAVHCLEGKNNTGTTCESVGNAFATATYDNMWFVGAEVSSDGNVFDAEYVSALFGIRGESESLVVVDADRDPDDSLLTSNTKGPFDASLRGSFSPVCNNVIQYGDGASVFCEADNLGMFFSCVPSTNWVCSPLITGRNFVHGARAGASVLVTPTRLYVHATGSRGDPENWTPIDFDLPSGVSLAAIAGDTSQWYVLANDDNTGKVLVYKFTW